MSRDRGGMEFYEKNIRPPKEDRHYFKQLITDSLRSLRAKQPCYVFTWEQIVTIKKTFPHIHVKEEERGIYKVWL